MGVVALYIVTFVFVLPSKCSLLGYSLYFVDNDAGLEISRSNKLRLEDAIEYLNNRPSDIEGRKRASRHICVAVLTTKRALYNGYLIQTVAKLAKETENSTLRFDWNVFNSAVPPEENSEVVELKKFELGFSFDMHDPVKHRPLQLMDGYDKHRLDQIEALEKCNNWKQYEYALILEDDAFAGNNFAPIFEHIIKKLPRDDSVGYIKLYHPEKWLGYGYDTKLELFVIVTATFLAYLCSGVLLAPAKDITLHKLAKVTILSILLCGYTVAFCYAFSRQHLLELLKSWSYSHFFVDAPGCCTSAVLYPTWVLTEFIKHLKTNVVCNQSYPIDLVPYDYFKSKRLDRLQVLPNMFYHIGFISSLGATKNPNEFFHLHPATF